MIQLKLASGTKRQYVSGVRYWIAFTDIFHKSPFTTSKSIAICFAIWRFLGTHVGAQTIRSNFSHINDFYRSNQHDPVDWVKRSWKLRELLETFDILKPPSKDTRPFTEIIVRSFKKYLNLESWTHYTLWAMFVLAYIFALRVCEYTETRDYFAPTLNEIDFPLSTEGEPVLTYTIPQSKANKTSRPETLASACCCPRLCGYHVIKKYVFWRLANQHLVDPKHKKYLFLYSKKTKIKSKSKSKKYGFAKENGKYKKSYVQFTDIKYRKMLTQILVKKFGKNYNKKAFRTHSFRYGGITDLAALGLNREQLSGISRHSINSGILYRYIRLTAFQIADLIKSKKSKL